MGSEIKKTPIEKSIIRYNSAKLNLFTSVVCLSNEDQADVDHLCDELAAQYNPVGVEELIAVDDLAALYWQARRNLWLRNLLVEGAKNKDGSLDYAIRALGFKGGRSLEYTNSTENLLRKWISRRSIELRDMQERRKKASKEEPPKGDINAEFKLIRK